MVNWLVEGLEMKFDSSVLFIPKYQRTKPFYDLSSEF